MSSLYFNVDFHPLVPTTFLPTTTAVLPPGLAQVPAPVAAEDMVGLSSDDFAKLWEE